MMLLPEWFVGCVCDGGVACRSVQVKSVSRIDTLRDCCCDVLWSGYLVVEARRLVEDEQQLCCYFFVFLSRDVSSNVKGALLKRTTLGSYCCTVQCFSPGPPIKYCLSLPVSSVPYL